MELRTSYVIRHKKRASTTPDWLREKQEHAHARMHVLAISVDAFPFLPCQCPNLLHLKTAFSHRK